MVFVIIYFAVLALIFVGVPVVLILIQIKARLIWRLLSVALALIGYCWIFSFSTRQDLIAKEGDYERGNNEFIEDIDSMALQGRTNDVHQACQEYLNTFWAEDSTTDFEAMIGRTSELALKPSETNAEAVQKNLSNTNAIARPQ